MEENMIKIDHVSKQYKLGQIGGTTLRDELQRQHAKRRGKEDPTKMIGSREYTSGETFMALDDVSFEVCKGERVGIIGHNGAGKSTLLKLISRVTAPSEGMIGLNGRVASMLEVGTGFHGELTGRENIYMNGAILGMTKKEIDSKIEDIIDFSECRQFIDTPVKRYSSGMYVKLAFAVAAHLDSEIMLMDEVLAVGDMAFQKKCLDKMNDVSKQECRTILYVSHNMNTIRQLCNRCIVLEKGRIVFDGDVEQAIECYMDKNDSATITYHNYTDRRSPSHLSRNAKLLSITIKNKEEARYYSDEKIEFDAEIFSEKEINKLNLRMEVSYADGTPVATSPENWIGAVSKNSTCIKTFSMSCRPFARGMYSVLLVLFEKDEFGNSIDYDIIPNAFFFEILEDDDIIWNNNTWGHIKLPSMIE